MEKYFKKEELQNNYPAFQNLIINTIKRLLYLEILIPTNNKLNVAEHTGL